MNEFFHVSLAYGGQIWIYHIHYPRPYQNLRASHKCKASLSFLPLKVLFLPALLQGRVFVRIHGGVRISEHSFEKQLLQVMWKGMEVKLRMNLAVEGVVNCRPPFRMLPW